MTGIAPFETIRLELKDGIAVVTLARPAKLNAVDAQTVEELLEAVTRIDRMADARALLLTGEGRAFCSGADLSGGDLAPGEVDAGKVLETHFNPLLEKIAGLQVPVVAAVNGAAAGAGCSLALCADVVVAARSAYFLQAFVNIGLVPDVGSTWLLPRQVGRARASAMMMLGERIGAEKAEEWGMIYRCVDDAELMDAAIGIAGNFANGPTRAYAMIRTGIRRALETTLTDTLRQERENQLTAGNSGDFAEGVRAFLAKEKPVFTGR